MLLFNSRVFSLAEWIRIDCELSGNRPNDQKCSSHFPSVVLLHSLVSAAKVEKVVKKIVVKVVLRKRAESFINKARGLHRAIRPADLKNNHPTIPDYAFDQKLRGAHRSIQPCPEFDSRSAHVLSRIGKEHRRHGCKVTSEKIRDSVSRLWASSNPHAIYVIPFALIRHSFTK